MITKYKLGQIGLDYVQTSLSWGKDNGKALASYLLDLPLSEGHVWTYLPADVDVTAVSRFEEGILPQQEGTYYGGTYVTPLGGGPIGSQLEAKFHNFVVEFLRLSDNPIYVLESENARLDDPWLDSYTAEVFFHGADVYHFVMPSDSDLELIDSAERSANSLWLFIRVLTKLPTHQRVYSRMQVTSELLSKMAENTEHIIVQAYDNEANVIWSRN